MLVDAVTTRLRAANTVERVEGVLELQALIDGNALPAATSTAFVVPMGLTGGRVEDASGAHVQAVIEGIGVALAVRTAKPTAQDARGSLAAYIDQVIAALAGWQPPGATDVLRLTRANLVSLRAGVALYLIEFSVTAQLRIIP